MRFRRGRRVRFARSPVLNLPRMKNENDTEIQETNCENPDESSSDAQAGTDRVNRKSKIVNPSDNPQSEIGNPQLINPSANPQSPIRDPQSVNPPLVADCVNRKSKIENSTRRPTGKVARLPRTVREAVNHMLDDGLTYNEIIAKLDEYGHPGFFSQNISRWKLGGYQAWVRQQERCQIAVLQNLIQKPQTGTKCVNRKSKIVNSDVAVSSGN